MNKSRNIVTFAILCILVICFVVINLTYFSAHQVHIGDTYDEVITHLGEPIHKNSSLTEVIFDLGGGHHMQIIIYRGMVDEIHYYTFLGSSTGLILIEIVLIAFCVVAVYYVRWRKV